MLMLTLLAAILFILSSGSLFTERFRKNKLLLVGAAIVVLISGYYLAVAVWTDFEQIGNKLDSVEEGAKVLPHFPEQTPPRQSRFPYLVDVTQSEARFVFPKEALDQLFRSAPNGDLSGAMFQVTLDDRLDVVCQHFVATTPVSNEPIYDINELVPKLDCDIWKHEPGGSVRLQKDSSYEIRKEYRRLPATLTITVSESQTINNILLESDRRVIFAIGFPLFHDPIKQELKRS